MFHSIAVGVGGKTLRLASLAMPSWLDIIIDDRIIMRGYRALFW